MVAKQASNLLMITIMFFVISCVEKNHPAKLTPTPEQNITDNVTPQQPTPTLHVDNANELLVFRGATGYGGTREYTIEYHTSTWEIIDDFESTPHPIYDKRLQHRNEPDCSIALYGGPMQQTYTGSIEIGGRKWDIAPYDNHVTYMTRINDPIAHEIAYFLEIYLPTLYDPINKSSCQQQAEQVIATFRIVNSIRQP